MCGCNNASTTYLQVSFLNLGSIVEQWISTEDIFHSNSFFFLPLLSLLQGKKPTLLEILSKVLFSINYFQQATKYV